MHVNGVLNFFDINAVKPALLNPVDDRARDVTGRLIAAALLMKCLCIGSARSFISHERGNGRWISDAYALASFGLPVSDRRALPCGIRHREDLSGHATATAEKAQCVEKSQFRSKTPGRGHVTV